MWQIISIRNLFYRNYVFLQKEKANPSLLLMIIHINFVNVLYYEDGLLNEESDWMWYFKLSSDGKWLIESLFWKGGEVENLCCVGNNWWRVKCWLCLADIDLESCYRFLQRICDITNIVELFLGQYFPCNWYLLILVSIH